MLRVNGSPTASHQSSTESEPKRMRPMNEIYASTSKAPGAELSGLPERNAPLSAEDVKAAHTLADPEAAKAAETLIGMNLGIRG